jgi:hypothetical protein
MQRWKPADGSAAAVGQTGLGLCECAGCGEQGTIEALCFDNRLRKLCPTHWASRNIQDPHKAGAWSPETVGVPRRLNRPILRSH